MAADPTTPLRRKTSTDLACPASLEIPASSSGNPGPPLPPEDAKSPEASKPPFTKSLSISTMAAESASIR